MHNNNQPQPNPAQEQFIGIPVPHAMRVVETMMNTINTMLGGGFLITVVARNPNNPDRSSLISLDPDPEAVLEAARKCADNIKANMPANDGVAH